MDYSSHGGPVGNGYGLEAVLEDDEEDEILEADEGTRLYDRSPWKPYRPEEEAQRPRYLYGRGIRENQRNGNG